MVSNLDLLHVIRAAAELALERLPSGKRRCQETRVALFLNMLAIVLRDVDPALAVDIRRVGELDEQDAADQ